MMVAGLWVGFLGLVKLLGGALLGQSPAAAFNLGRFIFRGLAVVGIGVTIAGQKKRKSLKRENRNLTIRRAAGPRETIYGFIRKGGTLAYAQQHDTGKKYLSFVILFGAHEVEDIKDVYFNAINLNLTSSSTDTDGIAQYVPAVGNAYAGVVRVKKHLGIGNALADADLIVDTLSLASDEEWTTTDRLRGICHLTIRIEQFHSVFQGQVPNVSAEIQGKNDIFDPAESKVTFTTDFGTDDKLDATAHGLSDGDMIRVQSVTTLPVPLDVDANYFLINKTANDFEISNERGGSAIKMEDNGTGTHSYIALKWTANAALCAANYVEDKYLGWREVWSETIDETVLNDSVSESDELIDLDNTSAITVDTVNNEVDWTAHGLVIDDQIYLTTTGSLPPVAGSALASNVIYWVQATPTANAFSISREFRGAAIDFTGAGSGTSATQCEPRYEAHGVLRADRSRENNLDDIIAAMAGRRVEVHGKLFLHAGKYTAPAITLDEDDVRGPITIETSRPKDQLFNAVKAIIISPNTDWQPGDAPTYNRRRAQTFGTADVNTGTETITITAHGFLDGDPIEFSGSDLPVGIDTADTIYYVRDKATNTFTVALTQNGAVVNIADVGSGTHTAIHDPYLSDDQGVRSYMDLQFDMVKSPYSAERLMKIALERNRQQLAVTIPCFLSAYQVQAGDTVSIDNARMGWTGKVFEVLESPLARDTSDNGEPFYGVDMRLIETASTVHDWSTTDELPADLAANTNLVDELTVTAPSGLVLVSDGATLGSGFSFARADGVIKSPIRATWTVTAEESVLNNGEASLEIKRSSGAWATPADVQHFGIPGGSTVFYFWDVEEGDTYDVRIRFVSEGGIQSDWTEVSAHSVAGYSSSPSVPSTFVATAIIKGVRLTWANPSEDDFQYIRIRMNTSDTTSGSTPFAFAFDPGSDGSFEWGDLTAGTTYYFFIDAFNRTGDNSATVGSVNAVPLSPLQGPAVQARGGYVNAKTYYGSDSRRDVVIGTDEKFYIAKVDAGNFTGSANKPTTGGTWATKWELTDQDIECGLIAGDFIRTTFTASLDYLVAASDADNASGPFTSFFARLFADATSAGMDVGDGTGNNASMLADSLLMSLKGFDFELKTTGNTTRLLYDTSANTLTFTGLDLIVENDAAATVLNSDPANNYIEVESLRPWTDIEFRDSGGTNTLGQKLDLYNTDYAFGIQGSALYWRSNFAFVWFREGVHHDTKFNAGAGGAVTAKLEETGIAGSGDIYFDLAGAGGEFRVNGTKVVDARQAAVADASGGATVDTEARAAINDLLARLRTHGLIAP